jgi:PAS domain S-box-containing protein
VSPPAIWSIYKRPRTLGLVAVLTAVYTGIAKLALGLDAVAGFATLVWPPSGIALAALLRGGIHLWPSVALGAFLVNLWRGATPLVAAGIAVGNTLEAVLGARAVQRIAKDHVSLGRLRDAFGLVFVAAALCTMVSATIGVSSLYAGGVVAGPLVRRAWLAWWLGDATGVLVFAPVFLLAAHEVLPSLRSRARTERVLFAVAVVFSGWLVFGPSVLPPTHDSRQAYPLFPVLIWAAVRFRQTGAVVGAFATSAIAIVGTILGYGPFVNATLQESLIELQAFMLVVAATGLLLGASKAELEATRRQSAFLAQTSEVLASSLDYATTLDQVARLAVPTFADWCIVDVIENGEVKRVAVAAADPEKQAVLLELKKRYPPDASSPQPAAHALRSGQPFLTERFTTASLAKTTRDPEHFALMQKLAPRSAMALPLTVQGRTVGAITFAQAESGRRYGALDLALGEEIARRAAIAVENARLHQASVTARLTAEEHQAKLAWWERVFEHGGWGVELTDAASGCLDAINPAFARMHGYASAGELLGRPASELFPPDRQDDLIRNARIAEETGHASFESIHLRKDGSRFPVSIDVVALRSPEGRLVRAANVIDLSDRQQIEDERARLLTEAETARAEAEQANRAKDEFLAMLGHELRNPLSPIVTAMQLMKLRGPHHDTTKEQEVIERQVRHLVRLVDDLLDVSRVTRGKIALRRAPVEIGEVVAKAVEMAGPLLEERKHLVDLHVPRTGLRVMGDQDRLAQVVTNLLTNAAKYTPPAGRIGVSVRREHNAEGASFVRLAVRDNGVGLPAELLPVVFDPFVQGPRSSERSEGGLGIGLALVKSLVQLHGGSVAARSAGVDQGSEFEVTLPLLDTATLAPVATANPAPMKGSGLRVLLVDDNRDAAELTAELLGDAGYAVQIAFDPATALKLAEEVPPEVAILDLGLPVMDGFELARRLREQTQSPPRFIALTGYGQDNDRARTASAGFVVHLVKPIDPEELVRAIEQTARA